MSDVLKKFGRYFLLDHIAQGGMAEIYRARLAAKDGAGRLLCIKRIQGGFGANKEFLDMFHSEIKVTMGFSHPNIVQLYDFGEEQQQPFIAMEFIDGKNLRQVMSRFAELKQSFPVDLAAYIIEQAASGLQYAHSFKDKITGEALNIVHRDISPQNIIVSYEGGVKVIDFGIAKATTNMESTRAGVIKGKPSYLSPEQISGESLDGRCDIFALGIVLWEVLCGKKLFAGENDLAVLKLIESCQTHVKPPSTINKNVPKELDYIVLRALAKQREKRYQTADELQRALHKFIYTCSPDFNPSDLAYYAKDLFKNEIVEDRKRMQRLNEKAEQLLIMDSSRGSGVTISGEGGQHEEATMQIDPAKFSGARELALEKKEPRVEMETPKTLIRTPDVGPTRHRPSTSGQSRPAPRPSGSTVPRQQARASTTSFSLRRFVPGALVATILLAVGGPMVGIRIPYLSEIANDLIHGSDARLFLDGNLKGVQVFVNGQLVATSIPSTLTDLPVGSSFQLQVKGQSGEFFQQDVTLKKNEKKVVSVVFPDRVIAGGQQTGVSSSGPSATDPSARVASGNVLLQLNLSPGGGSPVILVNGKSVDAGSPKVVVALDQPLELSVDRVGYKPFRREFVLESRQIGGMKDWLMDIALEPAQSGFLEIFTTPSADAIISMPDGGKPWVKKTPIQNVQLPVGVYQIRLVNDILGMEKTVTVNISTKAPVRLSEHLDVKN